MEFVSSLTQVKYCVLIVLLSISFSNLEIWICGVEKIRIRYFSPVTEQRISCCHKRLGWFWGWAGRTEQCTHSVDLEIRASQPSFILTSRSSFLPYHKEFMLPYFFSLYVDSCYISVSRQDEALEEWVTSQSGCLWLQYSTCHSVDAQIVLE